MQVHKSTVSEHYFLRIDDLDGRTKDLWDFEILIATSKEGAYYGKAISTNNERIELPWRLIREEDRDKTPYDVTLDRVKKFIEYGEQ